MGCAQAVKLRLIRWSFVPSLLSEMALAAVLPQRRWWDKVDDRLYLGALPFAHHAERLHHLGVRAAVNTCLEYRGPVAAYARLGIEQLRIPVADYHAPSLHDVQQAVAFIARHRAAGGAVYVHCKAGRGRSATIVLCWLVKQRGMSPEEAQQWLAKRRPHVDRFLYRRPVVQEFWRQIADDVPQQDPMVLATARGD